MGVLSIPDDRYTIWLNVLRHKEKQLCFWCYIGALIWFVMLGNREFNRKMYQSAKGLLPAQAYIDFNNGHAAAARRFYDEFLNEIEDKYGDTDAMPVPWLVDKLSQLHLEVYTHNFTLRYPIGEQDQVYRGTNVYGVLRAPRGSPDALVLSAPYRAPGSFSGRGTAAGIALMLGFAQFARPQNYWAKDIIFLITEHEQVGMQAWLEAYHGLQSNPETFYSSLGSFYQTESPLDLGRLLSYGKRQKCLNPGKLKGRSGSIQAAINLEIHYPEFKYIEVKMESLNGQLPNLDLVHLVYKLCSFFEIHYSYKNSYSWIQPRNMMEEWVNSLWTMIRMIFTQINGVPNGNHGLFRRFSIEAVTLETRDAADPGGPPGVRNLSSVNFTSLGVLVETTLRSLNNLMERFHQSYFFYLLPAHDRFLSISQFMPCLCLFAAAIFIRASSLWVALLENSDNDDKKTDTPKEPQSKSSDTELPGNDEFKEGAESTLRRRKTKQSELEELGEGKLKESKETQKKSKNKNHLLEANMSIIIANYLLVHLVGYGVMNSPQLLSYIGSVYIDQHMEDVSVYYGLIAISVFLAIATRFLFRLRLVRITREELSLINILVLIELATVCLTIGIYNFSLGFVIATLYTPLALVVGVVRDNNKKSFIVLCLKRVLCCALQPLAALTLGMALYAGALFPEERWLARAGRGADAAMQAVMFAVVDSMIYGNWLFNVASTSILPIWLLLWQILCT